MVKIRDHLVTHNSVKYNFIKLTNQAFAKDAGKQDTEGFFQPTNEIFLVNQMS
jgi:hypothetical protein